MPLGNILVADDDSAIRTVLNQALSRAGYNVRLTSNAATLWRWVSEGDGDLVITDVVMPDENAFDLLPRIKRARPDLPVVVMSAQNTFMTAIRASERGAYEYLPKPFDLKELIAVVGRALSEPRGRRLDARADEPADVAVHGAVALVDSDARLDARLGLVRKLEAVSTEELDAVVLERVVARRDHGSQVEPEAAGEERRRRGRQDAAGQDARAAAAGACGERRLEHRARAARVAQDKEAACSQLGHGGATELEGERGGEHLARDTAYPVGSEQLAFGHRRAC